MAEIDRMLEANEQWAQRFPGSKPVRPARAVAVVACMDSRMPLFQMLGLEVGDAHVIRNAGGVITEDTIRSLTISQHLLGTREIVLVHHTECGLQATDDVSFADLVEQAAGRRPPWAARAFTDVEDDVRESMRLIRESPYLLSREVRGTVYDVGTGHLREVRCTARRPPPCSGPGIGARRLVSWSAGARKPAGAARVAPSPVLGEAIPPAFPTTTEDTSAVRTYTPKPGEVARAWHVIDATDVVLGRLASQTAQLLRGKHKPQYAPHMDVGDFVVIVNAGKVALTGSKRDDKVAYRHSGHPGGLKTINVGDQLRTPPRPRHRARDQGDAAAQHPRPADAQEAQGLRRPRAPPRCPAAPDLRDQAGGPVTSALTVTDADGRPIQTVGRRKEAIVRVRLLPGTGQFKLNGRTLEDYFPNKVHQQLIREPFVTLEKAEQYDVVALLKGGGVTGQAGALRLGIARALIEIEADDRPALKKAGFLTRDPRVKERKKYGLKKARKAPQYSKR